MFGRVGSRLVLASLVFGSTYALAGEANAQTQTTTELPDERAARLANQGLKEYSDGKWDVAFESFEQADALVPSPLFKLYMARARRNQDRLLDAREIYIVVTKLELDENAPPNFRQAKLDAQGELTQVEQAIPTLVLSFAGFDGSVVAKLDGARAAPGVPIELDPGEHTIVIETNGRVAETRKIKALAGRKGELVEISAKSLPADPTKKVHALAAGPSAMWLAGWALAGVGAASLFTGAVLGLVALSIDEDITDQCRAGCFESDVASDRERMLAIAHASTGTLVAGGLFAAIGIGLVIADVTADKPSKKQPASVSATLSIGWVGVRAQFR